jgi:aminoglycoside 6'-N-acetyltransferase I
MTVAVRQARPSDLKTVMAHAIALWPDEPPAGMRRHMRALLAGKPESTLPLVIFLAERWERAIGFIEVGLRSHADGCDGRRPVGYIEGWYVAPDQRGRGVGRALMDTAEAWARKQGCVEMASDTWLHNRPSQRAHLALGFEIAERSVLFRKSLRRRKRA